MIDDGSYAMTIIGCRESSDDDYHIIMADPHLTSNRVVKDTGIYEVVLNK